MSDLSGYGAFAYFLLLVLSHSTEENSNSESESFNSEDEGLLGLESSDRVGADTVQGHIECFKALIEFSEYDCVCAYVLY